MWDLFQTSIASGMTVTSRVKFASVCCFDKDLKWFCRPSVTKVDLFSKVAFKISEDGDEDSVVVSCVHANSDVDGDFQSTPIVGGTEEQIFVFCGVRWRFTRRN